jgi:hypothetical protein
VQAPRWIWKHREAIEFLARVLARFEHAFSVPKLLRSTLDGGCFVSFLHRESLDFQGFAKAGKNTRARAHKRKSR